MGARRTRALASFAGDNMRRKVHELTDDEIVDAVAGTGFLGFTLADFEPDSTFESIVVELCALSDQDRTDDVLSEIEGPMVNRVNALASTGRILLDGDLVCLSSTEWARRLVGKSEDEIAKV
jgi:hypothetical protein